MKGNHDLTNDCAGQASNLAGVDKVSLADRHEWTTENLDGIMDSANDPFGLTQDGLGK